MTTIDSIAVDQVQFTIDGPTFIRLESDMWFKYNTSTMTYEHVEKCDEFERIYNDKKAEMGIF